MPEKILPRILTRAALLAALSFILGKFLQIPTGYETLRISFENLPLILCGYAFGPLCGAICAVCADLVGCMLYGYAINPIVTLGALTVGLCAGLFGTRGICKTPSLILSVVSAHLIGSVLIKSIGLHLYYGFSWQLLAVRCAIYVGTAAVEYLLLRLLLRNKSFCRALYPERSGKS